MDIKDICEAFFSHMEEDITLSDLIELSGITMEELEALIEIGVLNPVGALSCTCSFPYECILPASKASRLRKEFDLTPSGIALVLFYQERIHKLEKRLRELECHLLKGTQSK